MYPSSSRMASAASRHDDQAKSFAGCDTNSRAVRRTLINFPRGSLTGCRSAVELCKYAAAAPQNSAHCGVLRQSDVELRNGARFTAICSITRSPAAKDGSLAVEPRPRRTCTAPSFPPPGALFARRPCRTYRSSVPALRPEPRDRVRTRSPRREAVAACRRWLPYEKPSASESLGTPRLIDALRPEGRTRRACPRASG